MEERKLLEEIERLKNNIEILELQVQASNDCIQEMRNSVSWKVTAPIRWMKAHFAPLRSFVAFVRRAKTVGIRNTIHEDRVMRYQNKHRFAPHILPSEYKKQAAKRQEIPICYYIFIRIYEMNMEQLEKLLSSIANQTIPPKAVLLYGAEMSEDAIQVLSEKFSDGESALSLHLTPHPGDSKILGDIKEDDVVIVMDDYGYLAENCIYRLEMERLKKPWDVIYCDDALETEKGMIYQYKPDYAPHYLASDDYIGSLIGAKGSLFAHILNTHMAYFGEDVSLSYAITLNVKEGSRVAHIPEILYSRKERSENANVRGDKVRRQYWNLEGEAYQVEDGLIKGSAHVIRAWEKEPLISIIIPTCDHREDLSKCIRSIQEKTTYTNIEILIVENNSKEEETFAYYRELEKQSNIRILYWEGAFNYAAINNFAVSEAKGEYFLFLNNDVEVISPDWIQEMLLYASRKEVGAVGAKLYFPDDTIQHAGVILGIRRLAGHGHRNMDRSADGYMGRLKVVQDYTIVTAACLLVSREKFLSCHGFDEQLAVDYNDVDFCMKLRKLGYYNVFTPYAQLYHYESKSRGDNLSPEKKARNEKEFYYFNTKWYNEIVSGDPFYNCNLTLLEDDFSYKTKREFND